MNTQARQTYRHCRHCSAHHGLRSWEESDRGNIPFNPYESPGIKEKDTWHRRRKSECLCASCVLLRENGECKRRKTWIPVLIIVAWEVRPVRLIWSLEVTHRVQPACIEINFMYSYSYRSCHRRLAEHYVKVLNSSGLLVCIDPHIQYSMHAFHHGQIRALHFMQIEVQVYRSNGEFDETKS
jgi:hypothetical protein